MAIALYRMRLLDFTHPILNGEFKSYACHALPVTYVLFLHLFVLRIL